VVGGGGSSLEVGEGCGISVNADDIEVNNSDLAGDGLDAGTGCLLDVSVDNSTIGINGGSLEVKANGITSTEVDESDFDTVTVITDVSITGGNLVFSTTNLKILSDDGAGSDITISGTDCS